MLNVTRNKNHVVGSNCKLFPLANKSPLALKDKYFMLMRMTVQRRMPASTR